MTDRDPGVVFQETTRYSRRRDTSVCRAPASPPLHKAYPDVELLPLPRPEAWPDDGVLGAIDRRRSIRSYTADPLTQDQLGALLLASAGITATARGFAFRAAPSAGALYPIETYVVAHHVEGLAAGVYHYSIAHHGLEALHEGDTRKAVAGAGLSQPCLEDAAAVFVWTAMVDRCRAKYRDRGWRYVYLDAGHIAAHLSLAAVALGLGTVQVGAFYDDELAELLGVDLDTEPPLYLSTVGRPAGDARPNV